MGGVKVKGRGADRENFFEEKPSGNVEEERGNDKEEGR